MKLSQWFAVCKDAAVAWSDDFAPSMGAAISYYTMFSLAPLLVLVIAIAGFVFGPEAVRGQLSGQMSSLMGEDTARAVEGMIESASVSDSGVWASILSILVLIVGATSVFGELQSALDRIWHVPESKKPSGVWGILRARVFSFGLILGLAFLLMVSLLVSAGLAVFGSYVGGLIPGEEFLLQALNTGVSLAVMTVLFAMIFKLMPTTKVAWRDVWVGAGVTAALFEVGKTVIGLYLGKSGLADSFAGAGSLVILLAWVYYAAQIFLLGAEFTKVYAHSHGSVRHEAEPPAAEIPTKAEGFDQASVTVVNPLKAQSNAKSEIDRRVARAAAGLLRSMMLLGVIALSRTMTDRRIKIEKKHLRKAQESARVR